MAAGYGLPDIGLATATEMADRAALVVEGAVFEGYGLSETSPVASFNQPGSPRKPGTIGFPVRGCEMRVVDDNGEDVAAGAPGEIAIRGENVMKGYWNRPEATAEAIPDGWFRTGDIATVDADVTDAAQLAAVAKDLGKTNLVVRDSPGSPAAASASCWAWRRLGCSKKASRTPKRSIVRWSRAIGTRRGRCSRRTSCASACGWRSS